VTADHRTGIVRVEGDAELERDVLETAVDDAGYMVVPPGSSSLPMA